MSTLKPTGCTLIVGVFLSTGHGAEHIGRAKKMSCPSSAFCTTTQRAHTHKHTALVCESHNSDQHTQQKDTQPELLTQPVFSGNLAKSLPVGLPSSEEVDRAVLPALDHLHSTTRQGVRGQIHLAACFNPLSADSYPTKAPTLTSLGSKPKKPQTNCFRQHTF